MRMNLDELEIRVLGSLMEKELTTPENYPLSLNALVAACNQKSNRDPAMNLTEAEVLRGLELLGGRGLARLTTTGGRVPRYCHSVGEKLGLRPEARAVLAELMLRGPQTPGELRSRAERMATLADVGEVEAIIGELMQAGPPLVARLPRQAGRRELRYVQLFAGMPEFAEEEFPAALAVERGSGGAAPGGGRLVRLETAVSGLREEISELRLEIEALLEGFR